MTAAQTREARTLADLAARLIRARRHAEALQRFLEATGQRGEASAARTIVEMLDGSR